MTARRISPAAPHSFPLALEAFAYAARLHAGQRREADGAPFILHVLEVASLLFHANAPDHVIAAGILHDTIEKTDADAHELEARFGSPVAALVLAATEDARIIDYEQRKAALREHVAKTGREALTIFAADKVSKVRELRFETTRTRSQPAPGSHVRHRRLAHYCECRRILEELLPDSPLVGKLGTELERVGRIADTQACHPTPSAGGRV